MAGMSGAAGAPAAVRAAIVNNQATDGPVVVDPAGAEQHLVDLGSGRARLVVGDTSYDVRVERLASPRAAAGVQRFEVLLEGWRFEVDVEDDARARLRERATRDPSAAGAGGPLELRAIIPGRVVSVDVAIGDGVEAGGRLLVVEAMKMQNELRASRAGTVARIAVAPGQTVERGDLLLVVE